MLNDDSAAPKSYDCAREAARVAFGLVALVSLVAALVTANIAIWQAVRIFRRSTRHWFCWPKPSTRYHLRAAGGPILAKSNGARRPRRQTTRAR